MIAKLPNHWISHLLLLKQLLYISVRFCLFYNRKGLFLMRKNMDLGVKRKRKLYSLKQTAIILLLLVFVIGTLSIQPKVVHSTPNSVIDDLMKDWLPSPGGGNGSSPFQSGMGSAGPSGGTNLPEVPNLGDLKGTDEINGGVPADPVSLPNGTLQLKHDDLELNAPGFPITMQRLYLSEQHDRLGVFGYGWTFPYEHKLVMHADFNIVESRPDGSEVNYTFKPADASQLLDSYDGDTLVYYDLSQGSYV
jgi:hypothetical protein